ncbi:MAG: hypothetical protein ACK6DS_04635 [Planctomycetota bacterium]
MNSHPAAPLTHFETCSKTIHPTDIQREANLPSGHSKLARLWEIPGNCDALRQRQGHALRQRHKAMPSASNKAMPSASDKAVPSASDK